MYIDISITTIFIVQEQLLSKSLQRGEDTEFDQVN